GRPPARGGRAGPGRRGRAVAAAGGRGRRAGRAHRARRARPRPRRRRRAALRRRRPAPVLRLAHGSRPLGGGLASDLGTATTKDIGVDVASGWRMAAFREYRLAEPQPRWQVQRPRMVLDAVDGALAEVVAACAGRAIDVIGVGSAMHGLVGLDEQLRPVTDIITSADTRAPAEAAELRAAGRGKELLHLSGTPVHPMSPLVKLMWFSRHDTATASRVHRWVGLKDLVLLHLTGRLVTELSTASASGLLDLSTRQWSESSLALAGVRREQLPGGRRPRALLELSYEAGDRVGLPAGIPVNVGATDGPLGNLGTGAIEPGIAGLSMGTSGAVRTVVEEPKFDVDGRLFCYALTDDAWVLGAAISNGGVVARWAGEVRTWAMAADVPAGSDGLVRLPYLLGERAPLWDPELTGAFLGVRHAHGRGHFIRAAIEGVALQMSSLVDVLDTVTPVTEVRC